MPHAVIATPLSSADLFRELKPFQERDGELVLKVSDCFSSQRGSPILLEALVVEGGRRRFMVELDCREGRLTVRLYPLTDPEKTEGVRRLLAEVARRVVALAPGSRILRTNLEPHLAADPE